VEEGYGGGKFSILLMSFWNTSCIVDTVLKWASKKRDGLF